MTKTVVVSAYTEDISWTKKYQGKTVVYNKGNNIGINLPNIGREAHTYLYYIIKNYNDFDDITIFTQGDPFTHIPNFLNIINQKNIDDMWKENKIFFPASNMRRHDFLGLGHQRKLKLEDSDKDDNEFKKYKNRCLTGIKMINSQMGYDLKDIYTKVWGATFVVPKYNLLARPIQTYRKLIELSKDDNFAYAMEWIWIDLFSQEIKYL